MPYFPPVTAAGASSTKVEVPSFTTPSLPGGQTALTWQEIPNVCVRGMLSRLTLIPSGAGKYDLELSSAGGGGGELLLAATDVDGEYAITIPIYVEGDSAGSLWLGLKNKGADARTYTVSTLRVEKFS